MTADTRHTILISPLGELAPDQEEAVSREVGRVTGFPTLVQPLAVRLDTAYDAERNQYHSTPLLEQLAAAAPPQALKVLAVVTVDLFIPILTHVYGEAQLGGRACIVSSFRLNAGPGAAHLPGKYTGRIVKESIHELGHTFGLRHCRDERCIMHYCRSEADVDRKSDQLCRYCRIMLNDEIKRIGATPEARRNQ